MRKLLVLLLLAAAAPVLRARIIAEQKALAKPVRDAGVKAE